MIEIEVLGAQALTANLKKAGPTFLAHMTIGMQLATNLLERHIKEFKLNDGNPLHSRSHTLGRSIHAQVKTEGADLVIGKVGTNLIYAKTHEFGATIVPRNAKVLSFLVDGERRFAKRVVIPQRSFLRSGFQDKQEEIFTELQKAGGRAIEALDNGV